jgi:polysaccharide deacetylase family protein (PEP-CTERM system associated)
MEAFSNALTVDVEDYFQVSAFRDQVAYDAWSEHESRVVANTLRVLDLFDAAAVRGTFFVLGWVAERYPSLTVEIAARGHEIGCHGYSHSLIYQQSRDDFAQETRRAKGLLEDQSGQAVNGYRAASFSITDASRWALDVLVDAGFAYDSSMFPVRHDLYGSSVEATGPHRITTPDGSELVEFPMTARSICGVAIPISGGGYFRLYPYRLSASLLARVNRDGEPFVFYLHPWELDPAQPRIPAPLKSRLRHYTNLHSCERKLRTLLGDFRFAPMAAVLEERLVSPVPAPALR